MPVVPTPLPADRRQPAARVSAQRAVGEHTMISDRLGSFAHVKPVAWVRSRAGDDNHWTNRDVPRPAQQVYTPHPALVEFQAEQARLLTRTQAVKARTIESPTSSSAYGAHSLRDTDSSVQSSRSDADGVNAVGAAQVKEQQSNLWAPLDATSKRLGFAISAAAEGTPMRELERAQDRRRFQTVAQKSYASPVGRRVEVVVPESMNRTSPAFPLMPVNQTPPAALMAKTTQKADVLLAEQIAATQRAASRASGDDFSSSLSPAAQALQAASRPTGTEFSTAHAMGYGRRHAFHRHYLSSAPDFA